MNFLFTTYMSSCGIFLEVALGFRYTKILLVQKHFVFYSISNTTGASPNYVSKRTAQFYRIL